MVPLRIGGLLIPYVHIVMSMFDWLLMIDFCYGLFMCVPVGGLLIALGCTQWRMCSSWVNGAHWGVPEVVGWTSLVHLTRNHHDPNWSKLGERQRYKTSLGQSCKGFLRSSGDKEKQYMGHPKRCVVSLEKG